MVDHLHLLVQGMRQLQQLQMNRKDHSETEAVKGGIELQKMPEPGNAVVEFNDWIYVTEQMLGALTHNASSWFAQCLQCARDAYLKYQNASALDLERLSISPILTDSLKDPKWFKLERRVLSLLLAAMPSSVREDTITHRVENVAGVLYRLHVLYQPGGTLERTAILKYLEGSTGTDDPADVVAQLRRWRRHLARAEEMSIALPDASLQLRGIETIVTKVLEKFPDVKFRLALAKNDLRLASAPTAETVLSAPSCGTTTSILNSKVFGTGNSYDLDPRWREGRFVGHSSDVKGGLVVRYDDGTFVTSCHVREGLVDAEAIVEDQPIEAELPVPSRRFREKVRLALMIEPYSEVEDYAQELDVEERHDVEDVLSIWEKLKHLPRAMRRGAKPMDVKRGGGSFYTGCFAHGGVCGVMKMAKQLPNTTAYLVKAAKEITGQENFGCVAIVENIGMGAHRDSHNQRNSSNTITALTKFQNGQVWVEKDQDDFTHLDEWRKVKDDLWKRGELHELLPGRSMTFPPYKWHMTEPWEGNRVALLTYTPRLTNLSVRDEEELHGLGFNLPPREKEVPQADGEENVPTSSFHSPCEEDDEPWSDGLQRLAEDQRDLLEELQERSVVLRRLLEEEEILLEQYRRVGQHVTEEADHTHQVLLDMIEQASDAILQVEEDTVVRSLKGMRVEPMNQGEQKIGEVEQYLQGLTEELQVVIDVPLDQVKANLSLWIPSIDKELGVLFKDGDNGTLRRINLKDAKERERRGELTIVPSKLVFTCKPPNQGAMPAQAKDQTKPNEPKAKWRRKCRIVLCGNFAERPDGQSAADLYAAGASADSMRVALVLASACSWVGAGTDIHAAFLLAPWPKHLRRYAIVPSKALIMAERASDSEAWEVDRALYGLRESPAVWSEFRRQRLREARVPWKDGHLYLKASVVDPEVWMIIYRDEDSHEFLTGVLVTYVDDLLYLAEAQVIRTLHGWLCEEWPSSPLEWTHDGTRYLGVEIQQEPQGHFFISQKGYLETLVRSYDLEPGEHVRLPCSREWLINEDEPTEEPEEYSEDELRRAQKITGELLWVTRSRPDTLFVVMMMASALAKRPNHVYRVGLKVMAYLAASVSVRLQLGGRQPVGEAKAAQAAAAPITKTTNIASVRLRLEGFSDASFAPFGGRSYGASAITLNGSVVTWKCGRQAFTTMSVAEAELYEAAQTTLLMKGIHALLVEIVGKPVPQALYIDNSASVSLIQGCQGSWRTRHLKVRCAFLSDLVQQGELDVGHIAGLKQLADFPTKLHSKVRADLSSGRNVSIAGWDELTVVTVLVCIAAIGIWELIKRGICWALGIKEETSKERRLRRLRDMARSAAQEELDRECLRREIEVESEAWRRPLAASSSEPMPTMRKQFRTTSTQTIALPEPEPWVETRIVYRETPVPDDIPVNQFWKTTDHRSRVSGSGSSSGKVCPRSASDEDGSSVSAVSAEATRAPQVLSTSGPRSAGLSDEIPKEGRVGRGMARQSDRCASAKERRTAVSPFRSLPELHPHEVELRVSVKDLSRDVAPEKFRSKAKSVGGFVFGLLVFPQGTKSAPEHARKNRPGKGKEEDDTDKAKARRRDTQKTEKEKLKAALLKEVPKEKERDKENEKDGNKDGDGKEDKKDTRWISAFVEARPSEDYPPHWYFEDVQFLVSLINFQDLKKSIVKHDKHTFSPVESSDGKAIDRGWHDFVHCDEATLRNSGFVDKDDTVCFRASVYLAGGAMKVNSKSKSRYMSLSKIDQTGSYERAPQFLNSLVQIWYHLGYFRSAIYSASNPCQLSGAKKSRVLPALREIFVRLQHRTLPASCSADPDVFCSEVFQCLESELMPSQEMLKAEEAAVKAAAKAKGKKEPKPEKEKEPQTSKASAGGSSNVQANAASTNGGHRVPVEVPAENRTLWQCIQDMFTFEVEWAASAVEGDFSDSCLHTGPCFTLVVRGFANLEETLDQYFSPKVVEDGSGLRVRTTRKFKRMPGAQLAARPCQARRFGWTDSSDAAMTLGTW
eukprot:s5312_g2.t2